jgi:hypothetical protein
VRIVGRYGRGVHRVTRPDEIIICRVDPFDLHALTKHRSPKERESFSLCAGF